MHPNSRFRFLPAFATVLVAGSLSSQAATVAVNWDPDTTQDGDGTGTISSGNFVSTVTLDSGDGALNGGITLDVDWSTSLATDGAQTINSNAMVIDTLAAGATNTGTITFSQAVTDPIFLVAYFDPNATFRILGVSQASTTLLDANNAQYDSAVTADTAIIPLGTPVNSINDGFALRLNGTYSQITIQYSRSGVTDSVAFGIQANADTVPEPVAGSLALLAALPLLVRRRRR